MRDVSLIFEVPTIIITDMLECAHPPGTATLEFTPIFVIAEPSSLSSSKFFFDTHPTLFLFALHTNTVTIIIPARGWAGIPVPDHSREYRPPIPVPKVWEWVFHSNSRSQKLGMLFSIPVPVPNIREYNFPFPFPLAGMNYNVGNKMGIEFKSWEQAVTTCGLSSLASFLKILSSKRVCCVFRDIRDNRGLRIEDWGLRTEDWGLRTEDWGLRIEDWGLRIEKLGPKIEDWGPRIEDWGLRSVNLQPTIIFQLPVFIKLHLVNDHLKIFA